VRELEVLDIDPRKIREHASRFSEDRFMREIKSIIEREHKKYKEM